MNNVFEEFLTKGDSESFSILYNKYADILYSYGIKIIHDDYLVSESIQNLFINIYEKRNKLSVPDSVVSYLCVSLRRMLIRELEKLREDRTETIDDNIDSFNLEIDIESAMIQTELKKEQLDNLQKALDDLTAKQREVIYLKYYQNMNNDEIAEIMKINNQSVRNLTSQSLSILRKKDVLILFLHYFIPFI